MQSQTTSSEFLYEKSGKAYQQLQAQLLKYERWILLTDENTLTDCRQVFIEKLGITPDMELTIPSGETNKTLKQCELLWGEMLNGGVTRNTAIVNLGGGLISDFGGYLASCYKRGIDFFNVPTTLLAMVDAAHGGKTGINFGNLKNQIGVFNSAKSILYDLQYLDTLPETQLRSGFAEIIKHALIDDVDLWNDLVAAGNIKNQDLQKCIEKSIGIKSAIVDSDPFENGMRKKLNFGHTIGHAIESSFIENSHIFHGHAVAVGMICETYISVERGLLDQKKALIIEEMILNIFGKLDLAPTQNSTLIEKMLHDKKNEADGLNFTLLSDLGTSVVDQFIPEEVVLLSLNHYRSL